MFAVVHMNLKTDNCFCSYWLLSNKCSIVEPAIYRWHVRIASNTIQHVQVAWPEFFDKTDVDQNTIDSVNLFSYELFTQRRVIEEVIWVLKKRALFRSLSRLEVEIFFCLSLFVVHKLSYITCLRTWFYRELYNYPPHYIIKKRVWNDELLCQLNRHQ